MKLRNGSSTHLREGVITSVVVRRVRVVLLLVFAGLACRGATNSLGPLAPGGRHVLFIGNSLTYVNDLPGTVSYLASLSGDTIRTQTVAFPNYALEDRLAEGTAARTIALGGWEYVVLQQGLVAVGLLLGIPVALAVSRLLDSMLVGVTSHDIVTYVVVAGVLAVTGATAALIPARRAAEIEPKSVLVEGT